MTPTPTDGLRRRRPIGDILIVMSAGSAYLKAAVVGLAVLWVSAALAGPSGAIAGSVVGAEHGMLAFFTPSQELTPAATYTLFITGVTDETGRTVPLTDRRTR